MLFLLSRASFLDFTVSVCKLWSFSTPVTSRIVGIQKINLPRTVLIHTGALPSIVFPFLYFALIKFWFCFFVGLFVGLIALGLIWSGLDLDLAQLFLKFWSKKVPLNRGASMTLENREGRYLFILLFVSGVKNCRAGSGVLLFCSRGECVECAGVPLVCTSESCITLTSLIKQGSPVAMGGVEAGLRPSCTLTDLQHYQVASVKVGR